jgi:hypothetical protein
VTRYAVGGNRIDVREDGAAISLWWATKNEWVGLLDVTGLEVEALCGGFAREPFADDRVGCVFIAPADGQPAPAGPVRR